MSVDSANSPQPRGEARLEDLLRNRLVAPYSPLPSARINGLIAMAGRDSAAAGDPPAGVLDVVAASTDRLQLVLLFPCGGLAQVELSSDPTVGVVRPRTPDHPEQVEELPPAGRFVLRSPDRVEWAADPMTPGIEFAVMDGTIRLHCLTMGAVRLLRPDAQNKHEQAVSNLRAFLTAFAGHPGLATAADLAAELDRVWQTHAARPTEYARLLRRAGSQLDWFYAAFSMSARAKPRQPEAEGVEILAGVWDQFRQEAWQIGRWLPFRPALAVAARSAGYDVAVIEGEVQRRADDRPFDSLSADWMCILPMVGDRRHGVAP